MNEIVLKHPNVVISYATKGGMGVAFQWVKEVCDGEYGYKLSVGDKIKSIRYDNSNYDSFHEVTIMEIREDGLIVKAVIGPIIDVKVWNQEHTAYRIERKPNRESFFVPFKKWLPNGGWYSECNMYIEPCDHLYEKNKFAHVLNGRIKRDEGVERDNPRYKGTGIWYNSGRRWSSAYEANLNNFIKVGGQLSFDDLQKTEGNENES